MINDYYYYYHVRHFPHVGVTATPMCALENRQNGDKYCVLICQPGGGEGFLRSSSAMNNKYVYDDQCGDGGTCQPASNGIGVCTYGSERESATSSTFA